MVTSGPLQSRISDAAQKILSEELGIVEGCRLLSQLRARLDDPTNELFDTFVAVASETEDLPLGELRSQWSKESLARIEARVNAYINRMREIVLEDCRVLVKEYSLS